MFSLQPQPTPMTWVPLASQASYGVTLPPQSLSALSALDEGDSCLIEKQVYVQALMCSNAQGSCGKQPASPPGHATVGEWQPWMLCELPGASWDLECRWHYATELSDPQQGQALNMQHLQSVHSLCSSALAIVLEGQEVFDQPMGPGRLELTLHLVRRRTLRIAPATISQLISGNNCHQELVILAVKRCKHCCVHWLPEEYGLDSAGQRDALSVAVHQLRPQSHDTQTKGSCLRLLVCLEACLDAASEAATLIQHSWTTMRSISPETISRGLFGHSLG